MSSWISRLCVLHKACNSLGILRINSRTADLLTCSVAGTLPSEHTTQERNLHEHRKGPSPKGCPWDGRGHTAASGKGARILYDMRELSGTPRSPRFLVIGARHRAPLLTAAALNERPWKEEGKELRLPPKHAFREGFLLEPRATLSSYLQHFPSVFKSRDLRDKADKVVGHGTQWPCEGHVISLTILGYQLNSTIS